MLKLFQRDITSILLNIQTFIKEKKSKIGSQYRKKKYTVMLLTIFCNRPTEVKLGTVGIVYFPNSVLLRYES